MENFTTEYRQQTNKHNAELEESRNLHAHFNNVTVAGKPRYLKSQSLPSGIVFP